MNSRTILLGWCLLLLCSPAGCSSDDDETSGSSGGSGGQWPTTFNGTQAGNGNIGGAGGATIAGAGGATIAGAGGATIAGTGGATIAGAGGASIAGAGGATIAGEGGGASGSGGATGGAGGGGASGSGGTTTVPTQGERCGEGWGNDPIPGNVDLGLASSPEINAVNNGRADERAVFDQINEQRINAGLEPLAWSDQVANAARSHAADMNQLDYFDHGSSTRTYRDESGQTIRENWLPFPRIEFLYPGDFRRAGENIAMTYDPVGNAVDMWMGSDGHRAAILDEYGWTATHGAIGIDDRMVVFSPAQCNL